MGEGGFFKRQRVEFEDFLGGPRGRAVGDGCADGFHLLGGDGAGLIPPCGTDVGEDGGKLVVGKDGTLSRHFEVVGYPCDIDGPYEALESNFHGAVSIAPEPRALREGREGAAGGSFSIDSVAGGAIESEKLLAVLGGEGGGKRAQKNEKSGNHDGEGFWQKIR